MVDVLPEGGALRSWSADERFTDLVRQRGSELFKVAILLTGNRQDAEDVVQDAILAVSGTWSGVTDRGAYAYLRTAVVRRAIDGYRRSRPTTELFDSAVEDAGFLRFEQDREFFALIRDLPPQQRAVVVLRYYAGADDRAIARILEVTPSTVRSQASRALEKLRGSVAVREAK